MPNVNSSGSPPCQVMVIVRRFTEPATPVRPRLALEAYATPTTTRAPAVDESDVVTPTADRYPDESAVVTPTAHSKSLVPFRVPDPWETTFHRLETQRGLVKALYVAVQYDHWMDHYITKTSDPGSLVYPPGIPIKPVLPGPEEPTVEDFLKIVQDPTVRSTTAYQFERAPKWLKMGYLYCLWDIFDADEKAECGMGLHPAIRMRFESKGYASFEQKLWYRQLQHGRG